MLGRTLLFVAGGALVLVGLASYAASNVTFRYTHPQAPDLRIVVDRHGARVDLDAVKEQVAKETGVKGLPRAVVRVTDHDFGVMDPMTSGAYDFGIENVGDAPLILKQGPTSCKCTLSGLSADKLLPGQKGRVRLEWHTDKKQTRFEQTAVIYTNDPTQRHIALGVSGKVRMLIGTNHEQLIVDRIEPDKSVTKEVLLYSQIWSRFDIASFGTSLPGVTFAAERIEPEEYPELEALAVRRVKITLPGSLPQGEFSDTLRFRIRPTEDNTEQTSEQEVTLPLHGKVLRRLSIYGQGITPDGAIELGTVPRGAGRKLRLVMKVRDPQKELHVASVQVKPAFLRATVEPHHEEGVAGLYDLTVELPAGVEPCTYLGRPSGELTIDLDHPRIDDMTLEVRFAVAP